MDPLRRPCFDRAHQVRNRAIGPPSEIKMHMVLDTADVVENALFGSHDAANVRIQTFRDFGADPRRAALGRKNHVEQELCVRARHVETFAPPGAGCKGVNPISTGFASAGCAAPPLHPWLQPAAPAGPTAASLWSSS